LTEQSAATALDLWDKQLTIG